MRDYKVEKVGNELYLEYVAANDSQLDVINVDKITSCGIYGLAPVSLETQPGGQKCLKYNISNKITLYGYLQKAQKSDVLKIVGSIAQTLIFMSKREIPYNAMEFAINRIYVDAEAVMPVMICVPLQNNTTPVDLKAVFREIMNSAVANPQEDNSYISTVINYINNAQPFEMSAFKEFLLNIENGNTGASNVPPVAPAPQPRPGVPPMPQGNSNVPPMQPRPGVPPMPQGNSNVPPMQPRPGVPPMPQGNPNVPPMQPRPGVPPMPQGNPNVPPMQPRPGVPPMPQGNSNVPPMQPRPGVPPMPQGNPNVPPMQPRPGVPPMPQGNPNVPPMQPRPGVPPMPQGNPNVPPMQSRPGVPPMPQGNPNVPPVAQMPPKKEKKKLFGGKKNKNQPPVNNMPPQGNPNVPPMQSRPGVPPMPQGNPNVPPVAPNVPPMQSKPGVPPMPQGTQNVPPVAPQQQPQPQQANSAIPSAVKPAAMEAAAAVAGETIDLAAFAGLQNEIKPVLTRVSTGEQVTITLDSFRIGREPATSDYCVKDNMAVGRCHANIIKKDGQYYIVDNNSKNHTFIEGRMIEPQKEELLSSGMKITLANEDFEFKMM